METWLVIAIILVLLVLLVVFLIFKNRKDAKEFEEQLSRITTNQNQPMWKLRELIPFNSFGPYADLIIL